MNYSFQWFSVLIFFILTGFLHPRVAYSEYLKTSIESAADSNQQMCVIATAVLLSTNVSAAKYKIMDVCHGYVPSNVVRISFYPKTVPREGLPKKAILILDKSDPDDGLFASWFIVRGYDVALGCLPYSESSWNKIRSQPFSILMQTREEDRIAKSKAIEIATQDLLRERLPKDGERMHCEAYRYNFGWKVCFSFELKNGRQIIGSDITIVIGDDGRVKDVSHGL